MSVVDGETAERLAALIRTIPDFPKPGIAFRDITTLLLDAEGLALAVDRMAAAIDGPVDLVAGIEARGFVFGAALASRLGLGFIPIRKPGKLPVPTLHRDYALEYGTGRLELDPTSIPPGARVLLVDDLLATGGTALASARLVEACGAQVSGFAFLVELVELGGRSGIAAAAPQARLAALLRY